MAQPRVRSGVSSGGRFAEKEHAEVDIDLEAPQPHGPSVCGDCGAETKRRSGLCRRHDPAAKKTQEKRPGRTGSVVAGVEKDKPSGPVLDIEAGSLSAEEIGQCDYGFVPVYRSGALVAGSTRGCKNAVILPATTCHQHGGATESSLGRTVAKAQAEAARGECFPLAPEHWDAVDQRLSAAQGALLQMMDTDFSTMAKAFVAWRKQQGDTPSRFSINNQFLVLVQHHMEASRSGMDSTGAWDHAVAMLSEPHMTKSAWERIGRQPLDDADGVGVIWWQPGSKKRVDRADGESDEDYAKRVDETPGWRGRHGGIVQYPLSATDGETYEVAPDPLASARPTGFGDAPAAISTMHGLASDMGITVDLVAQKPSNGAMGYWSAAESRIVVWTGVGGGDERAVAHVLAHELGHARLGHSTDAQKEDRTPEKEVAAESFAALVCAHHGIDASEASAFYIDNWRQSSGINMKSAGTGPLRSAVEAFDDYVTATK